MKEQSPFGEVMKKIWSTLKGVVVNNWPFKLLALLIAVVLWSTLIANDDSLVREKTFSNVEISVSGQDTAKRNGFIVTSAMTELPLATFTVDVPQKQYEKAQASTFNLRADLSKIRQAGTQEIKLTTTNSSAYGTVTGVYPQTITLDVDSYVTRYRIPVTAIVTGSAGEKYYATSPSLDPPSARISGPKSLVNSVARIEVDVDQSLLPQAEGTYQTAYPFRLVNAKGEEIESRLIEVTSESVLIDSIVAEQTVYEKKEIPLEEIGLVTGEPAHGYEVKSVTITPEKLTVAGKHDSLELIDRLFTDSKIDLTNRTTSVQTNLLIKKPAELSYFSTNFVGVTVEIGESSTQRSFKDVKIAVRNTPSGCTVSTSVKYADAYITGSTLLVERLKNADVTLYCDASGLEVGEYDVPVYVQVESENAEQFTLSSSEETVHIAVKVRK